MLRVKFRRKREGLTDYGKRLRILESRKPRLVVRPTSKNIIVQLVSYGDKGDKVVLTVHTSFLKKFGWNKNRRNTPAAYLAGYAAGVEGKKKGVNEAVLDIGLRRPVKGSIVFAALKGAVDAGLKIPYSKEVLPSEDRLEGKHLKGINFSEVKGKIK